jgi:DNA-binding transcriptional LysR family regulator
MIDRYLLRYFLAVIDQGNFSKAAAACNVSQPTLSVGIAKLERALGKMLFNRTNQRVELTEAGVRLADHARRIEAEFALAEREVQQSTSAEILRLGILVTIPGAWIESSLTTLGSSLTSHRVELFEARERDLLDQLARGRIDAALSVIRDNDQRFASERLFSEGYSIAMPATHPLAAREMVTAADLADNPMIVRRQCELLSETSRFFTARGVRPFFPGRTMSDDRALRYVRSGLGVTVMPDCFCLPGVARPRLEDFTFERTIGILYASHACPARLRRELPLATLIATIEKLSHDDARRS